MRLPKVNMVREKKLRVVMKELGRLVLMMLELGL
jgi:hypothetical protein